MAQLTRDEIVSEGQLLAGRDDNATASTRWLQRWLDSVAASWTWPVLQMETIDFPLISGSNSVTVGGSGTIAAKVTRVLDNIWLYDSTRTMRRRLRIRHQLSSPADRIGPSAQQTGTPGNVRLFNPEHGVWTLYFDTWADKDYLLSIPYTVLPEPLALGTDIPWYQNDETMVQAVCFKNLEYYNQKDSPQTQAAQEQLAAMLVNDRTRYGQGPGINNKLLLNPVVFPKANR